jgi:hypothetical protein
MRQMDLFDVWPRRFRCGLDCGYVTDFKTRFSRKSTNQLHPLDHRRFATAPSTGNPNRNRLSWRLADDPRDLSATPVRLEITICLVIWPHTAYSLRSISSNMRLIDPATGHHDVNTSVVYWAPNTLWKPMMASFSHGSSQKSRGTQPLCSFTRPSRCRQL